MGLLWYQLRDGFQPGDTLTMEARAGIAYRVLLLKRYYFSKPLAMKSDTIRFRC